MLKGPPPSAGALPHNLALWGEVGVPKSALLKLGGSDSPEGLLRLRFPPLCTPRAESAGLGEARDGAFLTSFQVMSTALAQGLTWRTYALMCNFITRSPPQTRFPDQVIMRYFSLFLL